MSKYDKCHIHHDQPSIRLCQQCKKPICEVCDNSTQGENYHLCPKCSTSNFKKIKKQNKKVKRRATTQLVFIILAYLCFLAGFVYVFIDRSDYGVESFWEFILLGWIILGTVNFVINKINIKEQALNTDEYLVTVDLDSGYANAQRNVAGTWLSLVFFNYLLAPFIAFKHIKGLIETIRATKYFIAECDEQINIFKEYLDIDIESVKEENSKSQPETTVSKKEGTKQQELPEETPVLKIFDEDFNENVILYNQEGVPVEFEQIFIMPYQERDYCILRPLIPFAGMEEGEGILFVLAYDEQDIPELQVVQDQEIVDVVFGEYERLLRESQQDN